MVDTTFFIFLDGRVFTFHTQSWPLPKFTNPLFCAQDLAYLLTITIFTAMSTNSNTAQFNNQLLPGKYQVNLKLRLPTQKIPKCSIWLMIIYNN